jgi:uncharacterized membrane protein (DUF4010 family)
MVDFTQILYFLIAVALGALIGLEREHAQLKTKARGYGGIRTFPLIAMIGALAGYFSDQISIWILIVAFSAVALLIIISHWVFANRNGRIGLTTEIAGLATFLIGTLCYFGFILLGVTLAVLMTLLLYERQGLHTFVSKVKKEELYSTIKFAIIAFVVLPVIPDKTFGPFDFFNPRTIWMVVVLVSAISFLGYVLIRWIGERGAALVGFLGGFVSSTATTLSLVQRSKKVSELATPLFGVVAANAAMMLKILLLVFLLDYDVFLKMVIPIGVMIGVSVFFIAFLLRKVVRGKQPLKLRSPFTLKPAVQFALVFAAVLFIVKAATFYLGTEGVYGVAFVSGLFDSDSVVLSVLQIGVVETAAVAGVLAVIANTLSKGMLAFWFGERVFAERLSLVLFVIALFGGVALLLV